MFRITLTNYRCFENKTFTVPLENGIVLLNGNSGKGKTTILSAISYAINGKNKNITTIGKEKTKVELEINNLKIIRTRNPVSLTVYKDEKLYTKNEAQEIIDGFFGKEFNTINYIEQDSCGSFVFMNPADKMAFLEKMILEDRNIDKIKDKIKNETTISNNEINKYSGIIDTYRKILDEMEENDLSESKFNSRNYLNSKNILETNIEKINKKIKIYEQKLVSVEKNLENFRKRNELLNNVQSYEKEKDMLLFSENVLENLEKEIEVYKRNKEYNKKLQIYTKFIEREQYIKDEIAKIMIDVPENINKKISSLQKELIKFSRYKNINETLNNLDFSENIQELRTRQLEISDILKNKKLRCPNCKTSLLYDEGQLKKDEIDNIDEIYDYQELEKEYKKINKKIILYEQKDEQKKSLLLEIETFPEEIKKIVEEEHNSLIEKYKKVKELKEDTLLQDLLQNTCGFEIHEDKKDLVNLTKEEYAKKLEEIGSIREKKNRIENIDKNILVLKSKIDLLPKTKVSSSDIKTKVSELRLRREYYQKDYRDLEKWINLKNENDKINDLKNKLEDSENKYDFFLSRSRSLNKLKERIKLAETRSLEEFISSLNVHANMYIDKFFIEENMSVELKTIISSNGKPSLIFEVNTKNLENCDISIFSGGQKSRINLAYTLALAELCKNKLILLDECINSLDHDNCSIVLEGLKENTKGLIFLVSHQITKGGFSYVIDI